jgi:WhiB family redox-sensing transcriptional regulator
MGSCRGRDSAQFFHPDGERGASRGRREAAAKSVCQTCPVRAQCAAHALATREPYGVWGGFTEAERLRLLATGWEDLADRNQNCVDVGRLELRLGLRPTVPVQRTGGGASPPDGQPQRGGPLIVSLPPPAVVDSRGAHKVARESTIEFAGLLDGDLDGVPAGRAVGYHRPLVLVL